MSVPWRPWRQGSALVMACPSTTSSAAVLLVSGRPVCAQEGVRGEQFSACRLQEGMQGGCSCFGNSWPCTINLAKLAFSIATQYTVVLTLSRCIRALSIVFGHSCNQSCCTCLSHQQIDVVITRHCRTRMCGLKTTQPGPADACCITFVNVTQQADAC